MNRLLHNVNVQIHRGTSEVVNEQVLPQLQTSFRSMGEVSNKNEKCLFTDRNGKPELKLMHKETCKNSRREIAAKTSTILSSSLTKVDDNRELLRH